MWMVKLCTNQTQAVHQSNTSCAPIKHKLCINFTDLGGSQQLLAFLPVSALARAQVSSSCAHALCNRSRLRGGAGARSRILESVRVCAEQLRSAGSRSFKAKWRKASRMAPAEEEAMIGETDMPQVMQAHALRVALDALDSHTIVDCKEIAGYIKKQFDKTYGPGWQCVTGISFGSYITHTSGSFIHFCIGSLAVMLFKAAST